jgi:putative tricarboxylic transport membrane protein
MLLLFSLTFTGGLAGKSMVKGLVSVLLGLLFATVGLDIMTAQPRFCFGIHHLSAGFSFIPVLIGIFTLSEVFIQVEKKVVNGPKTNEVIIADSKDNRVSKAEMKACAMPIAVGSVIGTFLGALPGIGGSAACFIGYGAARSLSKNQEEWGNGALEGIAAAESTNNAICGANLVPLLSLGIPGNSAAALLGAALMIQGITPGPGIFAQQGSVIYAIFAAMILSKLVLLLVALPFINVAQKAVSVSNAILFPVIVGLSFVGAFAINNSMFDILVTIGFGVLGYFMRKFSFPTAPFVIAFLLGPMFERSFRQALMISRGNLSVFIQRPLALCFLILTVLSIAMIAMQRSRQRQRLGEAKTAG